MHYKFIAYVRSAFNSAWGSPGLGMKTAYSKNLILVKTGTVWNSAPQTRLSCCVKPSVLKLPVGGGLTVLATGFRCGLRP